MDQNLIALYLRHVAAAFDRQMRLNAFLEEQTDGSLYKYTTSTATLDFGDTVRFEALDLGSHADPDNSWLWTWCNPHLNLTPANRKLGKAVRELGKCSGIAALSADRQVALDDLLGPEVSSVAAHAFAAIVAGELGFDAYYTMPFEHGRFAAVIRDDRLRTGVPDPVARMLTVFPQALAAFPVPDHRVAFAAYARWYGLPIRETPQTIHVLADGKDALKAKFDRRGRLTELKGTVGLGG
jgi:hypothetical protein